MEPKTGFGYRVSSWISFFRNGISILKYTSSNYGQWIGGVFGGARCKCYLRVPEEGSIDSSVSPMSRKGEGIDSSILVM